MDFQQDSTHRCSPGRDRFIPPLTTNISKKKKERIGPASTGRALRKLRDIRQGATTAGKDPRERTTERGATPAGRRNHVARSWTARQLCPTKKQPRGTAEIARSRPRQKMGPALRWKTEKERAAGDEPRPHVIGTKGLASGVGTLVSRGGRRRIYLHSAPLKSAREPWREDKT